MMTGADINNNNKNNYENKTIKGHSFPFNSQLCSSWKEKVFQMLLIFIIEWNNNVLCVITYMFFWV